MKKLNTYIWNSRPDDYGLSISLNKDDDGSLTFFIYDLYNLIEKADVTRNELMELRKTIDNVLSE